MYWIELHLLEDSRWPITHKHVAAHTHAHMHARARKNKVAARLPYHNSAPPDTNTHRTLQAYLVVGGSGRGIRRVSLLALSVGLEEGGAGVSARTNTHVVSCKDGNFKRLKIFEIDIPGELDRTGSFERPSVD